MQFKISVILLLLVTLLLIVPATRADPIRGPMQTSFDTPSTVSVIPANSGHPIQSLDDDRGGHANSVPEPSSMIPLVVLAGGLWFFRKRTIAAR